MRRFIITKLLSIMVMPMMACGWIGTKNYYLFSVYDRNDFTERVNGICKDNWKAYLGLPADDYFWFNADNEDLVNAFFSDGTFLGGTFQPTYQPAKGDGTICSDYVGSIRIASGGTFTVHYASGITSVQFYVSGNGSQSWTLASSLDGQTYTSCGSFTGSTGGHPSVNASFSEPMAYVRLTNSASGNRDVQGMRLFTPADPASLDEIEEIDQLASSADEIYDLLGRRRKLAPNGQIYVHGGKKICF